MVRGRGREIYLWSAILLIGLVVFNVLLSWVLMFYYGEAPINIIPLTSLDPSWIPTGTHFLPALGGHYFGDYEVYVGYARSGSSAYYAQVPGFFLPAAYGPLTIVIAKILDSVFGWPAEVFVYLIGSLALFMWGIFRLLGRHIESLLVVLVLLVSPSVVMSLDRGNFTILVGALCAIGCAAIVDDRPVMTVVTIALAIALKGYAVLLLLVLIRSRRWRELAWTVLLAVAVTGVCFAFLPGNFVSNVSGLVHADLSFDSTTTSIADSAGAAAVIFKFLLLDWGPDHATHFFQTLPGIVPQLPGIAVLLLCLVVIWFARQRMEVALIAALAGMELAPIGADANVEIMMVIGLCLALRLLRHRSDDAQSLPGARDGLLPGEVTIRALIAATALIAVGAVPWLFRLGTTVSIETEAWVVIGPIADLLALCVLAFSLVRARLVDSRARGVVSSP
jgi:hypothetical protein